MKILNAILSLLLICLFAVACGTARTSENQVDFRTLARSAIKLGFDIDEDDYWPLMVEASSWVGVRYKYGGNDRSGVDCSGLTSNIYKYVYNVKLHRRSSEQYEKDVRVVPMKDLTSGDLVFFSSKSGDGVSHVGIYLKDGKFIHSSSSRGVVVDDLNHDYYVRTFVGGGKVR